MFRLSIVIFNLFVLEVPVPIPQEELVHVPMVVNHHRHQHLEQKVLVDVHVSHEKEDITHVSKIILRERVIQQTVEQVVEISVPMTHGNIGNIVLVLTVVNHGRQHHVEHEVISDVHVPHDRKRLFLRPR